MTTTTIVMDESRREALLSQADVEYEDSNVRIELEIPDGPAYEDEERSVFFSRLGGKPCWLSEPIATDSLCCQLCSANLYLLLQMELPITGINAGKLKGIDRVVYVFGCNSRLCTESPDAALKSIRAFMQLRKPKNFSVSKLTKKEPTSGLWDTLMGGDEFCGLDSNDDVNNVNDDDVAYNMTEEDEVINSTFDSEYPVSFKSIALKSIQEQYKPRDAKRNSSKAGRKSENNDFDLKELAKDLLNEKDLDDKDVIGEAYERMDVLGYEKTFKEFHRRVSTHPRQCVRISPSPLLFEDVSKEIIKNTPIPCCTCHNATFEVQLMPAILSFLSCNEDVYLGHIAKEKRGLHPLFGDGMEWGTIIVMGCRNCQCKILDDQTNISTMTFELGSIVQIEREIFK